MALFHERGQDGDRRGAHGNKRESLFGSLHGGYRPQRFAQTPHFHTEAGTVGLVDETRTKGGGDQSGPRTFPRPRFRESACESEEDGTGGERDGEALAMHLGAAGVYEAGSGGEEAFHLFQGERLPPAPRNETGGRGRQQLHFRFDFGSEGWNGSAAREREGVLQRLASGASAEAAQREPGEEEFVVGAVGRGKRGRIPGGKVLLGFGETAEEEKAADLEEAGVGGVGVVAVAGEGEGGVVESFGGKGEVPAGKSDFGLCDEAAGTGQGFAGGEGKESLAEKEFGAGEVAELRHGDAAESKGGGIGAEGDETKGGEGIAVGEGVGSGGDE